MGATSGPNPPDDEDGPTWKLYVLDVVSSAASVALVGFLIFSVSGVWPPLVAITSGSMEPHMSRGDLVFVMETDRFPGDGHHDATGVVTAETGAERDYTSFNGPGDVIIFEPNGETDRPPVIHRAMFWVSEGEEWVDRANPDYTSGKTSCSEVSSCPAPHAGFVTKGDANSGYDPVLGISGPVKTEWIVGKAEVRIPYMGQIRLGLGSIAQDRPLVSTAEAPGDGQSVTVSTPDESESATNASTDCGDRTKGSIVPA